MPSYGLLTNFTSTYLYGRDVVHIDSYHELLQAVFKKPIHQSPKHLQRMRMALQHYSLDIRYKKGRLMFIADALSRSYRLTTDNAQHDNSEKRALLEVHHTDGLSVSQKRFKRVQTAHSPGPRNAAFNMSNTKRGAIKPYHTTKAEAS